MRQFFCIVCDVVKLSEGQLCDYCENEVNNKEILFHTRFHDGVKHHYLFEWNEDSDHFCKRVVYFLKNKKPSYFKEWASYFRDEIKNMAVSALLAPKSTTEPLKYNHAQSFALCLQKLFPYSCVIEVESGSGVPQKRKTKKERLRGERFQNFGLNLVDSHWVFTDDVFVTGGTYEKVRNKMGSNPECIVTLFYRSLWETDDD